MKKGYFINCISMPEEEIKSSGVMKKVYSQIEVLRKHFDVEHVLVNTYGKSNNVLDKIIRRLPFTPIDNNWKYEDKYKDADFIYFRKSDIDYTVYKFFKDIKKNNKNTKILFEIPTYPYDKEEYGDLKDMSLLLKDRLNRKKIGRIVDRIITYSKDDYIFGAKTIETINGIDFSKISIKKQTKNDDINMIAVASLNDWHGYDRLISGIGEYYKNGGTRNIFFHIVGDGSVTKKYKQLAKEYKIEDRIIFYGKLFGKELDRVYDIANLGVDSLGRHRCGIKENSSIKGREYAAKGLPIICTCFEDFLDINSKYQMIVSSNDEPININNVIEFYDSIYKESLCNIAFSIRNDSSKKCDINNTMLPIVEYIND